MVRSSVPSNGPPHWSDETARVFSQWVGLIAFLLSLHHPEDPTDLVVTVEADDYFYSPELFRETAAGIPNARLCLYAHIAHPAGGKRFREDVLQFLREGV